MAGYQRLGDRSLGASERAVLAGIASVLREDFGSSPRQRGLGLTVEAGKDLIKLRLARFQVRSRHFGKISTLRLRSGAGVALRFPPTSFLFSMYIALSTRRACLRIFDEKRGKRIAR